MNKLIIIMGVSGCGKTTIGKLLAEQLQCPFLDADNFHSQENIQKMKNGIALTDADRLPWLQKLNDTFKEHTQKDRIILACSALKESYRILLSEGLESVQWIYLKGEMKLILTRMKRRTNHFMTVNLLQSQFDTLEEPLYGMHISIENTPEKIVKHILQQHT